MNTFHICSWLKSQIQLKYYTYLSVPIFAIILNWAHSEPCSTPFLIPIGSFSFLTRTDTNIVFCRWASTYLYLRVYVCTKCWLEFDCRTTSLPLRSAPVFLSQKSAAPTRLVKRETGNYLLFYLPSLVTHLLIQTHSLTPLQLPKLMAWSLLARLLQ